MAMVSDGMHPGVKSTASPSAPRGLHGEALCTYIKGWEPPRPPRYAPVTLNLPCYFCYSSKFPIIYLAGSNS